MAYRNFGKDLYIVIYYPSREETFFDQSIPGLYILQFKGEAS